MSAEVWELKFYSISNAGSRPLDEDMHYVHADDTVAYGD